MLFYFNSASWFVFLFFYSRALACLDQISSSRLMCADCTVCTAAVWTLSGLVGLLFNRVIALKWHLHVLPNRRLPEHLMISGGTKYKCNLSIWYWWEAASPFKWFLFTKDKLGVAGLWSTWLIYTSENFNRFEIQVLLCLTFACFMYSE